MNPEPQAAEELTPNRAARRAMMAQARGKGVRGWRVKRQRIGVAKARGRGPWLPPPLPSRDRFVEQVQFLACGVEPPPSEDELSRLREMTYAAVARGTSRYNVIRLALWSRGPRRWNWEANS